MSSKILRLVSFLPLKSGSLPSVGLLRDQQVHDLAIAFGSKQANLTMKNVLEESPLNWLRAERESNFARVTKFSTYSLNQVKLLAPISNPEKIICVGLNYHDHAIESGMPIPSEPVLFSKFSTAIVGTGDVIFKPKPVKELDYEVELVIVIGKKGKNIPPEEAKKYIAGYTVGHDVSARDWQLKKPGGQWLVGKSFDTSAPIGPAICVDVPDPHNLGIRCTLNGNIVQNSNTKELIFKSEYLISYISKIFTLSPGDLIFTGTPPGVGMGRKPPLWMKSGDKVTCEIDELGSITNTIQEAVE
jgi:2-keto-4-pentenoate hydratase/2-oxohepta-3-ene-1,7-dioic acid hydratase in catechol pathway